MIIWKRIGILTIIILILYIEIFNYYINKQKWNNLLCFDPKICLKILLVADPQIIGHDGFYLTPVTVYDSDRFLKISFRQAYDFVKPDVIIFLGDLMDEGSIATDQEYDHYIKRFFEIFPNNIPHLKQIWLPGDNDIGGEGQDFVTSEKINRFNTAFPQENFLSVYNKTFFKINRMIQTIPKFNEKRNFSDTSHIFVGLSHIPLIYSPSSFVDNVLSKMQPHLLFTAHEHKSMIVTSNRLLMQDRQIFPITPEENKVMKLILGGNDIYEILVPPCSYRMGTGKIGYGYAIFENNTLAYTVLWSPPRLNFLFMYCILIIILLTLLLFKRFKVIFLFSMMRF